MKSNYSPDELATLPQTQAVFDQPKLVFDNHKWQQEGYMITDVCDPARMDCQHVGIPIPNGQMLVKNEGGYQLVDETDATARTRS